MRLVSFVLFVLFSSIVFAQQPATDPYSSARDAAQAGAGWVLGQVVGQQVAQQMDTGHKTSILNSFRESLRGQLLMRYAFSHQSPADQVQGYVIPIWEGKDRQGHLCRQVDLTMNYRYQLYFARVATCLLEDGQWHNVGGNPDQFGTNPPGRGGGWLPPFPRK